MNVSAALGVLSLAIGVAGYVPFLRGLRDGTYVPHGFSWSVFALMTGIAYVAQYQSGAGAGAWVTGFTAFVCVGFAICGFSANARRYIAPIDWLCLAGSLVALSAWFWTSDSFAAVVLITIVDAGAYAPMIRKAYVHPETETMLGGFLSGLKFVPAIMALDVLSVTTVLYPASLVATNALYVLALYFGKRKVRND
jgi:hypothetical protein